MTQIWLWRLAIGYTVCFFIGSLCTTILGSLANASWKDMDGQGRFMLVVAIVGNLANTLIAFISKEAKKISDGESPVPSNGTDVFKKAVVDAPPKTP